MKKHIRKIVWTATVAATIASASAVQHFKQVSNQADQISASNAVQSPQTHNLPVPTLATPQCDKTLWQYIYHPARLKILEDCKTVEGTLVNMVQEADGDSHGRLSVTDPTLTNQDNVIGQHGYMVLEAICQYPITQADAIQPCQRYSGPKIDLAQYVGKKIRVTGTFVQDTQHNKGNGGWLELHPLTSVEVLP